MLADAADDGLVLPPTNSPLSFADGRAPSTTRANAPSLVPRIYPSTVIYIPWTRSTPDTRGRPPVAIWAGGHWRQGRVARGDQRRVGASDCLSSLVSMRWWPVCAGNVPRRFLSLHSLIRTHFGAVSDPPFTPRHLSQTAVQCAAATGVCVWCLAP